MRIATSGDSSIVLSARELSIGYMKGKRVLQKVHSNLSFELKAGELTSLIGPNGAGKSTLLRTISGGQPSISGEITLLNKPLSHYSVKEISRQISLVLTERTFAGGLRVCELVGLGRHPHTGFFGQLGATDERVITEALTATGMNHKRDCFVAELSDGERQKTMIAKALAQESDIIILDEPTSFLDIISRIEIINLLRRLAQTQQKAILLSTHDMEQALISSDKLWLLSPEEGLTQGSPEDLILRNTMQQLFPHHEIHFDISSGTFRTPSQNQLPIRVTCDAQYRFWVNNLLGRYGFQPTALGQYAPLSIQIDGVDDIKFTNAANCTEQLYSFEQLADTLRKNKTSFQK